MFAYRNKVLTNLYAFSSASGACSTPRGALIFGADGKLYGTAASGGFGVGCIFSPRVLDHVLARQSTPLIFA